MRLRVPTFALFLISVPLFAADYVVTAPKWGKAQATAVAAAGGTVRYAHGNGFALVSSDAADFAARANASKAFSEVNTDRFVQWRQAEQSFPLDTAAVTPGDETYSYLQWAPQAVKAPGAWAAGYTGAGVRVAVLDGGIYDAHDDLNGSVDVARSVSFVPGQAFNQDTNTFWHGTHVAGIVAARDNGKGIIGIAPGATIVGVKIIHNGGGDFGAVIAGIYYAATPVAEGGGGADIINMSFVGEFQKSDPGAGRLIGALNKAMGYATSHGVLLIAASGNSGFDYGQQRDWVAVPAELGGVLAISASAPFGFGLGATNYRNPALYSNYGESMISLAGPGGDFGPAGNCVPFPCWLMDLVLSTTRGSGSDTGAYTYSAGTSMAAPAVAGVAALAKQAHPGISLGALKTLLLRTADDEGKRGHDEFYGHGYPNAERAVQ
ncbi:MAG TPA: S8 family serine peptidase [Thermoanaerobaculia bacterium]|nr:S8 family serine peptidase [Thermoanaerobaculia bacterium]